MIANLVNISQISSVRKYILEIHDNYTYQKGIYLFCFCLKKEGFYYKPFLGRSVFIKNEEIEKNKELFIMNNTVYYKPHLEIKMLNKDIFYKFFNTESELNNFLYKNKKLKNKNFIS